MIEFDAAYYDGRSSARRDVRVRAYTAAIQIVADGLRVEVPLAKLRLDPPVGGTRRILHLPDGAQLQTDDSAAIESLFPRSSTIEDWVHRLESRWPYALAALALVAAFSWWGVVDGLPRAAKLAAAFVPKAVEAELGAQTLEFFEGKLCGPSALPPGRQEAVRERFARLTSGLDDGYVYRVLPRDCRRIGANAFALPGGTVVITDALVKLARNDDQVEAVLAHEVGHVHNRHGLRMGLQAAGLAALAFAVFGDATSVVGLATALPMTLLQNGYSRDFETEADEYAFARLKQVGVSPRAFADALLLLEKDQAKRSGGERAGYFSTHPATAKRIERALAAQ
ncbi:MAG TPA: M48 family metallopeptidase [Burkholderiales bacterium]|nr:M48 family metallopeptidase [Burkholderiales bacterium]